MSPDRQQITTAYMRITGATRDEAEAIADLLLDPDPASFLEALKEWAQEFDQRRKREDDHA